MCNISDYLEPCDVWVEHEVKARKEHSCDCCGKTIRKGEKYTRHFDKFEGEITSEKMCLQCEIDRDVFAAEHDHIKTSPGCVKELIYECLYARDSLSSMLKWARVLKRMDKRKMIEEQPK